MTAPVLEMSDASAAGFLPEQIDRIRQRAGEWIAESHTQSLVLLAARRGRIGLYESYGEIGRAHV